MNRLRALTETLTPAQAALVLTVFWASAIAAIVLALWLRRRNRRAAGK